MMCFVQCGKMCREHATYTASDVTIRISVEFGWLYSRQVRMSIAYVSSLALEAVAFWLTSDDFIIVNL